MLNRFKKIAVKFMLAGYLNRAYLRLQRFVDFLADYHEFRRQSRDRVDLQVAWRDRYPCLYDKTENTGFDRHYVFHTAWAARVILKNRPLKHVDVSSSLYFCSILSASLPIEFFDYRPATLGLDNLRSERGDLLRLPFENGTIQSISCMHVVEHIGLGRYGDPLDSNGDLQAMAELKRVLAPSGDLLFVVPVGRPRVMFNAHRIYSYEQILHYFSDLILKEFALIPDEEAIGGLIRQANPKLVSEQTYGCGCFWFRKPASRVR